MFNLFSNYSSNKKTEKSDALGVYKTAILYMTPSSKLCPHWTPGCRSSCLYTAGRGVMSNVKAGRLRRTKIFLNKKELFFNLIDQDIIKHKKYCEKNNLKPCIRMNGTSDINFSILAEKYSDVQFYDYTKDINKVLSNKNKNYHLTYSHNEKSIESQEKLLLSLGHNIAVVFDKVLPETFLGAEVIDGTKHDLRFLDKKGVIVGLLALGKAKKDTSGFVIKN